MKRPMDPRKHGLKEPQKMIVEDRRIRLEKKTPFLSDYNDYRCSLLSVLELWEEHKAYALRSKKSIIEGPYVDFCRSELSLTFKTEMRNQLYAEERAGYDAQVKEYEAKVEAYEAFLKRKELGIQEKIDDSILRLEHKLANLRAIKNEEPVPFPDD
jgi:hypothetical protein